MIQKLAYGCVKAPAVQLLNHFRYNFVTIVNFSLFRVSFPLLKRVLNDKRHDYCSMCFMEPNHKRTKQILNRV